MTVKNDRAHTRHPGASRYRADIGGDTLMLLESRKVATLLLDGVSDAEWRNAIEVENILQKTSTAAAKRIASLIRARLETVTKDAIEQARKKGDGFLLKALADPLDPQKIAKVFEQKCPPSEYDLFLLSGAGSVFPVLRTHSLLTALHPIIKDKPLVLFFPGTYDGLSLKLFGKLKDDNYYRAFKLLPDRGRP